MRPVESRVSSALCSIVQGVPHPGTHSALAYWAWPLTHPSRTTNVSTALLYWTTQVLRGEGIYGAGRVLATQSRITTTSTTSAPAIPTPDKPQRLRIPCCLASWSQPSDAGCASAQQEGTSLANVVRGVQEFLADSPAPATRWAIARSQVSSGGQRGSPHQGLSNVQAPSYG